ncbi:MAG TPA: phosphotransferase [Amycolatopsis sp.]|nr:phosphotransferase [Amycolatopsis sp.]
MNEAVYALNDGSGTRRPPGRWRLPRPVSRPITRLRSVLLLHRVSTRLLPVLTDGRQPDWRVHQRLAGQSGTAAALVGPPGEAVAVLKVSDTAGGRECLRRQAEVLTRLHADQRLGAWRRLLPRLISTARIGTADCSVESRLPGADGRRELADARRRDVLVAAAVAGVGELSRRTGGLRVAGEDAIVRWVREPVDAVRAVVPPRDRPALDRMADELAAGLAGLRVALGWQHGDYTPGNVLVADGVLTGVIDWGQAVPDGMPVLDVVSFLLNAEAVRARAQLGSVVASWLRSPRRPEHGVLSGFQRGLGAVPVDPAVLVRLAWLRHVAGNLAESTVYRDNPLWIRRNVAVVLRAAGDGGP